MPIALDPNQTFDYTLEDDRSLPDGERTVFHLRPLAAKQEARIADSLVAVTPGSDEMRMLSGTHTIEILRAGLVGWDNFLDAGGEPVKFEMTSGHPRTVRDQCLDRIASRYRTELANAITSRGDITGDELD